LFPLVANRNEKSTQDGSASVESGLSIFNEDEIRSFARRFESLFNERKSAIMASYYADDARILAHDTDVSGGRHVIEEFWRQACAHDAIQERTIRIVKVESTVDMGYVLSVVKLRLLGSDGQTTSKNVNDVTVWKKNSEARWEIVLDFAASPVTSADDQENSASTSNRLQST
jgi:ketosteroid isomerase-like protein